MREKVGLWLVRMVLILTGNRALANASIVLPLVQKRQFAISPEPFDRQESGLLSGSEWLIWDPSGASRQPLSEESL